jgi:hypothetical protein
VTKFATNFISLQSVVEQKVILRGCFWDLSGWHPNMAKPLKALKLLLVFNDGFWKDAKEIIVVTESLVKELKYLVLKFFQCSPIQLRSQTSF